MIDRSNWSFEAIRHSNSIRAAHLDSSGSPEDLIQHLAASLAAACISGTLRVAVDSKDNTFVACRTIIQFRVQPGLYDWFFNARTGYRAQFWIAPDHGMIFNERVISSLKGVLSECLPGIVTARRIKVITTESREEIDCGVSAIPRGELLGSLAPVASKIWICERLYDPEGGPVRNIGFAVLSEAEQSPAKLNVPRWTDAICPGGMQSSEGLRAPWPTDEYSWLDLKGAFLAIDGPAYQLKPQNERADQIHSCGWT